MSAFSTGISEIVLIVRDVPGSAQFYEEVVGLEPVSRTATSYYFYDPDGNLLEFWSPEP